MPQLTSFVVGGHVVGVPFDASFLVTTVNKAMFAKAGITTMPTTIDEYTDDLQKIKTAGVAQYPLNIPFAAAEGLSTYWYQTTPPSAARCSTASSGRSSRRPTRPGTRRRQWMVDAIKNGLVPPGNINVTDSQGQQTLMAKGSVGQHLRRLLRQRRQPVRRAGTPPRSPGRSPTSRPRASAAPGANISNPDGIGIPKQAKYPQAAAKFIDWFTSARQPGRVRRRQPAGQGAVRATSCRPALAGVTQLIQQGALERRRR